MFSVCNILDELFYTHMPFNPTESVKHEAFVQYMGFSMNIFTSPNKHQAHKTMGMYIE